MMKDKNSLKIQAANVKLRNGDWEGAIDAYYKIIEEFPEFAKLLQGNIEFSKRRISVVPNKKDHEPTSLIQDSRKRLYLHDLYEDVKRRSVVPNFDKKNSPLVSVIVTSHNTEDFIEACLESLISQSYPNIEIVVVDDLSTDLTIPIVQRIIKSNSNLKLVRLATNLGTYFAKNYGIKISSGKYIFFQDSDDICHPDRIALQMEFIIKNPQAEIVRGAYSRIDPVTLEVIPVNGLFSKLGLITLGVNRDVFGKIGYFNCTTKASDDEFYNRIVHFLGKSKVVNIDLPLYYNTMREGSLFADMVHWNDDGSIQQKPSPARQNYVDVFRTAHSNMAVDQVSKFFSFPKIRDPLEVYPEMTKLANPSCPVIVNVCSIPEREKSLERVLRGISRQCDEINVYLDRYDSTPSFLNKLGVPVNVYRSQELPGLRDNGKFIKLSKMVDDRKSAYYFTIDDDIDYPDDYVNAMIKHLKNFDNSVIIGVHGITLKDKPVGYFSQRRMVYAFTRGLERYRFVNILGTGTVAFHTSAINDFNLLEFNESGMVDLYFAKSCIVRSVPMVCVPRHDAWLREIAINASPTLFNEFKNDDSRQTAVLKSVETWGMDRILKTISQCKYESNDAIKSIPTTLHPFTKTR